MLIDQIETLIPKLLNELLWHICNIISDNKIFVHFAEEGIHGILCKIVNKHH